MIPISSELSCVLPAYNLQSKFLTCKSETDKNTAWLLTQFLSVELNRCFF